MSYNVFFYNGIENAAENMAESVWNATETFTHYIALPYLTYQVMNWMFRSDAVQPKPQGFFSRAVNGVKNITNSVLSKAGKFVGAEVISHSINQWWLKTALWNGAKPVATAFLRPVLERLVLAHKSPADKGDINFSLREMIPGGEGTWLSETIQPILKMRNGISGLFRGAPTTAELLAPKAYELGDSFAKTVEAMMNTVNDVLGSTAQIGPCLKNPEVAKQCYQTARDYFAQRANVLDIASTPLKASFEQWSQWGLENMHYYYDSLVKESINCASQIVAIGNMLLWDLAQTAEDKTKVPAHVVYYTELALLAYMTYRLASFGKELVRDTIRAYVIPSRANGYFVNNVVTQPIISETTQPATHKPQPTVTM
ncbi:MAG: hypothetical protein JSS07_02830 [Proteobacteria bacterium]|nr:hypothetical protein [Pseudomonadota bacterium]